MNSFEFYHQIIINCHQLGQYSALALLQVRQRLERVRFLLPPFVCCQLNFHSSSEVLHRVDFELNQKMRLSFAMMSIRRKHHHQLFAKNLLRLQSSVMALALGNRSCSLGNPEKRPFPGQTEHSHNLLMILYSIVLMMD